MGVGMERMTMVKGVDMFINMCGYVWTCPHCKCGVHMMLGRAVLIMPKTSDGERMAEVWNVWTRDEKKAAGCRLKGEGGVCEGQVCGGGGRGREGEVPIGAWEGGRRMTGRGGEGCMLGGERSMLAKWPQTHDRAHGGEWSADSSLEGDRQHHGWCMEHPPLLPPGPLFAWVPPG